MTLAIVIAALVPAGTTSASLTDAQLSQLRDGIGFYRDRTWEAQAELGVDRTPTAYADRWAVGRRYLVWVADLWRTRAAEHAGRVRELNADPRKAIRHVFGRYASEALGVSGCETGGTYHVGATNGQYQGIFQMGAWERSRYGHGPTALEQARAAYRYFVDSGRDWSPWACRWAAR